MGSWCILRASYTGLQMFIGDLLDDGSAYPREDYSMLSSIRNAHSLPNICSCDGVCLPNRYPCLLGVVVRARSPGKQLDKPGREHYRSLSYTVVYGPHTKRRVIMTRPWSADTASGSQERRLQFYWVARN